MMPVGGGVHSLVLENEARIALEGLGGRDAILTRATLLSALHSQPRALAALSMLLGPCTEGADGASERMASAVWIAASGASDAAPGSISAVTLIDRVRALGSARAARSGPGGPLSPGAGAHGARELARILGGGGGVSSGLRCVAFDFMAESPHELSLRAGDIVTAGGCHGGVDDWVFVMTVSGDGPRSGYVPASYLKSLTPAQEALAAAAAGSPKRGSASPRIAAAARVISPKLNVVSVSDDPVTARITVPHGAGSVKGSVPSSSPVTDLIRVKAFFDHAHALEHQHRPSLERRLGKALATSVASTPPPPPPGPQKPVHRSRSPGSENMTTVLVPRTRRRAALMLHSFEAGGAGELSAPAACLVEVIDDGRGGRGERLEGWACVRLLTSGLLGFVPQSYLGPSCFMNEVADEEEGEKGGGKEAEGDGGVLILADEATTIAATAPAVPAATTTAASAAPRAAATVASTTENVHAPCQEIARRESSSLGSAIKGQWGGAREGGMSEYARGYAAALARVALEARLSLKEALETQKTGVSAASSVRTGAALGDAAADKFTVRGALAAARSASVDEAIGALGALRLQAAIAAELESRCMAALNIAAGGGSLEGEAGGTTAGPDDDTMAMMASSRYRVQLRGEIAAAAAATVTAAEAYAAAAAPMNDVAFHARPRIRRAPPQPPIVSGGAYYYH